MQVEKRVRMNHKYYYNFPIGCICIEDDGNYITAIDLVDKQGGSTEESKLAREAYRQLREYFEQKRTKFNLPICFYGTEFQKKVWNELRNIPFGSRVSYKEIATKIGNPNASRAVGGAINKNPILIVVPCHRVIGANGKLIGFACGMEVKKYLLDLEEELDRNKTFIERIDQ